MKNLFATTLCTLAIISFSFAQATFQSAVYVPNYALKGYDVLKTADNNLLFAASYSTLNGISGTGALVKTDLDGNPRWTRTCDLSFTGILNSVIELNNFYYAIGSVKTGLGFTGTLIKTDADGNLVWSRRFDYRKTTSPVTIIATADDNLLIAGKTDDDSTASNSFLIKIDTDGAVVWNKIYTHDENWDFDLNDAIANTDGTIYIAGIQRNPAIPSSAVSFIVLLDSAGNVTWSKNIQGGTSFVGFQKLIPTTSNGCFVGGSFDGTNHNICFSRIDNSGALLSTKSYTTTNGDLYLRGMDYSGGNIVFAGAHDKPGNADSDMLLFKVSLTGAILASETIGSSADEEARQVIPYGNDGRLLVLGSAEPDSASRGLLLAITRNDFTASCDNHSFTLTATDVAIGLTNLPLTITSASAGSVSAAAFNSPALNVLDTVLCGSPVGIDAVEASGITIFPNPAAGQFNVQGLKSHVNYEMRIFDAMGREVYLTQLSKSASNNVFTLEDGFYLVQLNDGKETITRKLMVQH